MLPWRRRTKVSPIELGLPLACLATRSEGEDERAVETILEKSSLSRERVRGELWLLRSIAVEFGVQITFGAHDELTHALWAFYFGFLTQGASEMAHLSEVARSLITTQAEKFMRSDLAGWTKLRLNGSERWGIFAYEPRRGGYRAAMQTLSKEGVHTSTDRFYAIGKEFSKNVEASDNATAAAIGAQEWQSTEEATSTFLAKYEISRETNSGPLKEMASGKEAEKAFASRRTKPG